MMDHTKYQRQYELPPKGYMSWAEKDYIDHPPVWCSVDLRDGNQALVVPMTLEQKLAYFRMLVEIGFKEIEVGFPAASETEYLFVRALIERKMIPDDVRIQVLTQAREHIIRRTFEALRGASGAIVHVYNATSGVQRRQVFHKSKQEILRLAVEGAGLLKEMAEESGEEYRFEYSPESFSGTEPAYALEVCNAVLDVWKPDREHPAVINLPSTVQLSLPHVYAAQVEYISRNLQRREAVVLSLHPHNDRGSGISDAELGLLAGADRIEGTLFGNGERTGNVDLVTLAMNLYAQGVDPKLKFDKMLDIRERYEQCTGMSVNPRSPYSGQLVFTAFSGSHQDAIAKAMKYREENHEKMWTVPYLPIDPADIGRSYETDVIRINSQSGKGGVSYILEQVYGLRLPEKMRSAVTKTAKNFSDHEHVQLPPEEVFSLFKTYFENVRKPFDILEVHFKQHNGIIAEVTTTRDHDQRTVVIASGNGRLNAVSNALKKYYHVQYEVVVYEEHALERSSRSRVIAYVGIESRTGELYWGAGIHVDLVRASIDALLTAVNNMVQQENDDSIMNS